MIASECSRHHLAHAQDEGKTAGVPLSVDQNWVEPLLISSRSRQSSEA